MIEVLIAVLILAVGLLGVAALQVSSLNSGQEGYFRTQATAIGEDFAARVHAVAEAREFSPDYVQSIAGGVGTDAKVNFSAQFVANPLACAVTPPAAIYCRPDIAAGEPGQACTASEMIAFNNWEICRSAATLLPGGIVSVAQNTNRLSIAVAWVAASGDAATEDSTLRNPRCNAEFALATELDCVILETVP